MKYTHNNELTLSSSTFPMQPPLLSEGDGEGESWGCRWRAPSRRSVPSQVFITDTYILPLASSSLGEIQVALAATTASPWRRRQLSRGEGYFPPRRWLYPNVSITQDFIYISEFQLHPSWFLLYPLQGDHCSVHESLDLAILLKFCLYYRVQSIMNMCCFCVFGLFLFV
jgi:hypothetical protein